MSEHGSQSVWAKRAATSCLWGIRPSSVICHTSFQIKWLRDFHTSLSGLIFASRPLWSRRQREETRWGRVWFWKQGGHLECSQWKIVIRQLVFVVLNLNNPEYYFMQWTPEISFYNDNFKVVVCCSRRVFSGWMNDALICLDVKPTNRFILLSIPIKMFLK